MERLERIKQKIFTRESIQRQCNIWRFMGSTMVFTNGCFDLLHLGHIEYLSRAADLGNELIIGLNSDLSVGRLKGHGRPVNPEQARAIVLASIAFVSAVVLFDEDTPYGLICAIKPDILVKGADYSVDEIAGHDVVLAAGGRVITIPLTEGYSTSLLLDKIRNRR